MSVEFSKQRTYDVATDGFAYRVSLTADITGFLTFEQIVHNGEEAQSRLINELYEALVSNTILDLEALRAAAGNPLG